MLPTEENKLSEIQINIAELGNELLEANLGFYRYLNNSKYQKISHIKLDDKASVRNRINQIDNSVVTILALYQPEARDLRSMVSCLKATNEIDKLFNLTRSLIKEFSRLPDELLDDYNREFLIPMQRLVTEACSTAFQMLEQPSPEQASAQLEAVEMAESQNGDIYKLVEKSVLSKMKQDLELSHDYQSFLSVARKMEKLTGRCLSLAMLFEYAAVGGQISRYP